MKKIYTVILSLLGLSTVSQAQWVISTTGATTDTITFDASFTGVNNGAFTGSGLDASPASGLLNSNAWMVTGLSDGNTSIGGSFTSGDYARGTSSGGASSGGLYSFEVASGDVAFGVQPGGSDFTPGTMTLAVVNGTGSAVDSVALYYDLFINNDADRGNTFNPSYAINSGSSTALSTLNDTSIEATQGSVAWIAYPKSIVFPETLNANDTLYITWSSDDQLGGGSRDEFALDNIAVSFLTTVTIPTPPVTPTYDIATITTQDANGEPDSSGVYCWTKGVVLGVDLDGNAGYSFTLWDNDGINIYSSSDVDAYVVTEGDSIMVRGSVNESNGLTRFTPDSIVLVNQNNTIPTPTLSTTLDETTESELVRFENFFVADYVSGNYILVNGTDTVTMRVDYDTDVDDNVTFNMGDTICYIIGIGAQYDQSSPYFDGYQFFPQRASDVDNSCGSIPPAPVPFYPIAAINNVDANGEADSLGVYCWTQGVVVGIDFDGNAGYSFTIYDEEGINVFEYNDVSNYVVTEGDSIMVRGEIDFFNGLTEIVPDSIHVISQGNPIPSVQTVMSGSEQTESTLIRVVNVYAPYPNQWGNSNSSFNVMLYTCNGDSIEMRIDSDTDVADFIASAPTGYFTVTGIGGQYDNSSPYFDNYQIFPTSYTDIDTTTDYSTPTLYVNEVMADNDAVIMDDFNEYDDWVELYNPGTTDVALAGLFLTDDSSDPRQYMIPVTNTEVVPAGSFALIWCDSDEDQGDLHTNFSLSASGEYIGIVSYDGCNIVDSIDFPAMDTDISYGRRQDGDTAWVYFSTSTPDASNNNGVVLSVINNGKVGENALQVYPNPATDIVYFNKTVDVQVYNVTGQLVTENKAVNTLDVSDYETGIYIIRTTDGEIVRMVKQ